MVRSHFLTAFKVAFTTGLVALALCARTKAKADAAREQASQRILARKIAEDAERLYKELRATAVDVSQCPDLAPAVAAALAVAKGEGSITGGKRLHDKESDRIASIAACLNALGAKATPLEDGLRITGVTALKGGEAASDGDHRIAMMAAGGSPLCKDPIVLSGWEAVAKSWPGFWGEFGKLGGACNGEPMG